LSEEVLRPSEMREVTIAESAIAENLRDLLCTISDSLRELREAITELGKGMRESVRIRSSRVLNSINKAFESFRNYMGHFVRVRLGLDSRDLYYEVFKNLRSSLIALKDISWRLQELCSRDVDSVKLSKALEASSRVLEVLTSMSDAIMVLLDNPRGSVEVLSAVHRDLNYVEETLSEALPSVDDLVLRELYSKFIEFLRSLSSGSENLMWIAIQRM